MKKMSLGRVVSKLMEDTEFDMGMKTPSIDWDNMGCGDMNGLSRMTSLF